jgi:hypothetical protein
MAASKRKAGLSASEPPSSSIREAPEVIVDFVFREGVFYIAVANVSSMPALDVSIKFDKPFRGLAGQQKTSTLPLFTGIRFLAPYKTIETLLDASSAYFARREPTRITAHVSYKDAKRRSYERRITHDLGIYKDVTYVLQRDGTHADQIGGAARYGRPRTWQS